MTTAAFSTFPEFLENALQADVREIGALCRERPGHIIAQRQTFYERMSDSWLPAQPGDLPHKVESELRPLYGRGLVTSHRLVSSFYSDTAGGIMDKEVKALLMYAHRIVVLNPLSPFFKLEEGSLKCGITPDGMPFVHAVRAVAELATLIRSGVVLMIDNPAVDVEPDIPFRDIVLEIAQHNLIANHKRLGLDQSELYQHVEDAFNRFLVDAKLGGSGDLDLGGSGLLERGGIEDFVRTVHRRLASPGPLPTEEARLADLMRLSLPGVELVRDEDMITLRDSDAFRSFRVDMRQALAVSRENVDLEDYGAARQEISEFMGARADELRVKSLRGRLAGAFSGPTIAFGVGVALASISNWQAALVALLARGAYDVAAALPKRSDQARHRHYVALSTLPVAPDQSLSKRIGNWGSGSD